MENIQLRKALEVQNRPKGNHASYVHDYLTVSTSQAGKKKHIVSSLRNKRNRLQFLKHDAEISINHTWPNLNICSQQQDRFHVVHKRKYVKTLTLQGPQLGHKKGEKPEDCFWKPTLSN